LTPRRPRELKTMVWQPHKGFATHRARIELPLAKIPKCRDLSG
jgi:hypothetical protein